ncbi:MULTISPECIES: glutathione S-transferase family protein [Nitratireductor]|uniref:glutathione S-transferase family protein n=1 Tax=Nitratireductor TaxID=245876 RepID=UPI000FD70FD8|nr:glutathione S-transferase family protein [Nitratireductor alexandrii]
MTKLTLISFPLCPFVQRAVIALKEKSADFDVVYIDLADRPGWFREISPFGKVPILKVERDREEPVYVFESSVIVEYIEEAAPGPKLHPQDALQRARHRAWMEFASQLLGDLWKYTTAGNAADLDAAAMAVREKFGRLEGEVEGPYFAGGGFSFVDAAFGPAFRQIDTIETVLPTGLVEGFAKLEAWRKALADRASVKTAVPTDYVDRYLGFLRKNDAFVLGSHT